MTETSHRSSRARMLHADRRHLSLVDCTGFLLMEREGIRTALAVDQNFTAAGFQVVPSLKPQGSSDQAGPTMILPARRASRIEGWMCALYSSGTGKVVRRCTIGLRIPGRSRSSLVG